MHTHVSVEFYTEDVKEGGRPLTGRAMQSNLMKQPKLTYTYECFIAPRVITASPGAAAIHLYLPASLKTLCFHRQNHHADVKTICFNR